MTIEFTEFRGPTPILKAVLVTESNVEELAVWMGADTYSIEKTLVGGDRIVIFKKWYDETKAPGRTYNVARTMIGHYLVEYPEHYRDDEINPYGERFFSITQADITNFTKQQESKGFVELDDKE